MSTIETRESGRTHTRKLIEAELMRLAPGDPLPPVRALMKTYEVSLGRLQAILSDMEEDGLIERRARQGNFKADATGLAQLTPFVDLIVVDQDPRQRPYHSTVVEALSERVSRDGHGLRLHRLSRDRPLEEANALVSRSDIRACILLAMNASLANAICAHAPIVSVCLLPKHDPQAYECPCITTSPEVPRLQLEHLWQLGHKRIAFLDRYWGENPVWSFLIRREAYYRLMAEKGVSIDPKWVVQAGSTDADVVKAMTQLFDLKPAPTAVIASDVQLAAIYRFLASRGLEVGRDVSVVGTDDMPEALAMRPATTTVHISSTEAADLALSTLGLLCTAQRTAHVQAIEPQLIVRESTALCPDSID